MPRSAEAHRKLPLIPLILGGIVILCLIAAGIYLSRPKTARPGPEASVEAKAYLPNLALSDVTMQASENFMKQQVVEVRGAIQNNGAKTLRLIEVYCIFYNPTGQEVHRERQAIVSASGPPLAPGQKRDFRLPFDALPDGWNQALPRLVIAQIRFAR